MEFGGVRMKPLNVSLIKSTFHHNYYRFASTNILHEFTTFRFTVELMFKVIMNQACTEIDYCHQFYQSCFITHAGLNFPVFSSIVQS